MVCFIGREEVHPAFLLPSQHRVSTRSASTSV